MGYVSRRFPRGWRAGLRDWLGLPALSGHRFLAAALVVDTLGDGMFIPFAVVYFLKTTVLPLPAIGLGLSAAGLLALLAVPVSGQLTDRLGPVPAAIAGNLVSAAGVAGYLTVGGVWQLVIFGLLAAAGGRLYWTANLALVGAAFDGAEQKRWFAFQRAVRNAGFGLGGVLGAAAVAGGGPGDYRLIAAADAASFAVAAALVAGWHRRRRAATTAHAGKPGTAGKAVRGGYRAALSSRPFLMLTAVNFLFVVCMMAPQVLLAVYLVRGLHQPAWLAGVLFTANTVIVAAGQTALSRAMEPVPPIRVLRVAAATWSVSFLLLWVLGGVPGPAVVLGAFAALAVFTAAEMTQGPTLNALVIASAPESRRGRYLAVYQLSWALGRAAAPGLLTWLFSAGPAWPWLTLSAACAAVMLPLGRLSPPPRPARRGTIRPGGTEADSR